MIGRIVAPLQNEKPYERCSMKVWKKVADAFYSFFGSEQGRILFLIMLVGAALRYYGLFNRREHG